jgi:hypothetical protein
MLSLWVGLQMDEDEEHMDETDVLQERATHRVAESIERKPTMEHLKLSCVVCRNAQPVLSAALIAHAGRRNASPLHFECHITPNFFSLKKSRKWFRELEVEVQRVRSQEREGAWIMGLHKRLGLRNLFARLDENVY